MLLWTFHRFYCMTSIKTRSVYALCEEKKKTFSCINKNCRNHCYFISNNWTSFEVTQKKVLFESVITVIGRLFLLPLNTKFLINCGVLTNYRNHKLFGFHICKWYSISYFGVGFVCGWWIGHVDHSISIKTGVVSCFVYLSNVEGWCTLV